MIVPVKLWVNNPRYTLKMVPGSLRLIRAFGIDVFVHWSWFAVALLILFLGQQQFSSVLWSLLVCVSLFALVLVHEYGHAFACRLVGGRVELILLSLIGGAAFMQTPQKPGAILWSVVAGPLVNLLLVPATAMAYLLVRGAIELPVAGNDMQVFLFYLFSLNLFVLVYNMLPIYPMDGGQTLVALLWVVVGRPRAMRIVGVVGMVTASAVILLAAMVGNLIILMLTALVGWRAWCGYKIGQAMQEADPGSYDDRYADQAAQDEVEGRIRQQVDPWRR